MRDKEKMQSPFKPQTRRAAKTIGYWLAGIGIKIRRTVFWDRCHDENLDGKLGDKQFDDDIFCLSWEAQMIIEQCKALYNSPSRRNNRQWSRPPRS